MAKRINKSLKTTTQKPIEQYEHKDKQRANNPPVGLVDAHTDNGGYKKKAYQYDPHIDPQLQWAGKAEHTSFDIPTVSLHVHERIDPRRIIESIKKEEAITQMSLFDVEKKPLREAIEFYKHKENWSNRLIAGDSLLIMNSLLEKEDMGGKVQMVYFDPPYGIKYKSNFQPFTNKKEVDAANKDEDLTTEPEMIKAFRDTWELGIHSYITYVRDRLLLTKDLLHESGSVFMQISDENVHHVRELLDEIFGPINFVAQIIFQKTGGFTPSTLSTIEDYIIWFAKDKKKIKFRPLFNYEEFPPINDPNYSWLELADGTIRRMTSDEKSRKINLPPKARIFRHGPLNSQGASNTPQEFEFEGKIYLPAKNRHWTVSPDDLKKVAKKNLIVKSGNDLAFKLFWDFNPAKIISNIWLDTQSGGFNDPKIYVVQTTTKTIQRCILMSTDPGDLVLDITCGSGTSAYVAENWGRRWITCDTSRVALTLTKQRLMTANFDYFQLAHPSEGVGSGFNYKKVPHVTVKSVANSDTAPQENLIDQPILDIKRARITGPFTYEAVPSPIARSFEDIDSDSNIEADSSISRSGETLRQNNWIDELLKSGVRGKSGGQISFTRMEFLSGTRFLQAQGETKEDKPKRVVVCFGPEHAPLEQRMVELALEEARTLKPKPEIILFCAFHFDSEARKDIEETNWPGITLLEAQMNADMLTDDLKKKRSSNESFWLIGQPDVQFKEILSGEHKGKYTIEINGFDYYNPKTGTVDSGGKGDIAMWMLDQDYDGRSLFPSQVFFPMAGEKAGWATLAKNLRAEIDEEKIEAFGGTISLPFVPGKNVAIKIIDARGIESLKIIRL